MCFAQCAPVPKLPVRGQKVEGTLASFFGMAMKLLGGDGTKRMDR